MDIFKLRHFFNGDINLPNIFNPEPAMTVKNAKRFIEYCFEEIEYENQLQRIREIRFEWLLKLKHLIENPIEDPNPENLYIIKTHKDFKDCFRLPFYEYELLRNKIQSRLLDFYENVRCNDAGLKSHSIHFYCKIGQHGIMQSFNVEEWIDIERRGVFDKEYLEVAKQIECQSGWARDINKVFDL